RHGGHVGVQGPRQRDRASMREIGRIIGSLGKPLWHGFPDHATADGLPLATAAEEEVTSARRTKRISFALIGVVKRTNRLPAPGIVVFDFAMPRRRLSEIIGVPFTLFSEGLLMASQRTH